MQMCDATRAATVGTCAAINNAAAVVVVDVPVQVVLVLVVVQLMQLVVIDDQHHLLPGITFVICIMMAVVAVGFHERGGQPCRGARCRCVAAATWHDLAAAGAGAGAATRTRAVPGTGSHRCRCWWCCCSTAKRPGGSVAHPHRLLLMHVLLQAQIDGPRLHLSTKQASTRSGDRSMRCGETPAMQAGKLGCRSSGDARASHSAPRCDSPARSQPQRASGSPTV